MVLTSVVGIVDTMHTFTHITNEDVDVYYSGHRAKSSYCLKSIYKEQRNKKNECIQYTEQFPYKVPKE